MVWLVYGRGLDAPLIFDDQESVLANPSIVSLWPLWGTGGAHGPLNPPRDICTAGRPVVNLSLAVNYHCGGFTPRGYHLVNVCIHTLSALLLWSVVGRTLRLPRYKGQFDGVSNWLALAAALLWSVHPLVTEAVQYVTQRSELLVGCFYLATLYASLRYWSATGLRERALWLTAAATVCAAGMASKEVMVSAPLVVLLFERTFLAGSLRRAITASWPLYVSLAGGWVLLVALNYDGPRSGTAGFNLGLPAHVWWFTQAKVLCIYLRLVIWPWPQAIHYQVPYLESLTVAWPWLAAASLTAVTALVLLWRRTAPGFVAAAAGLILAPTLAVPILTEVAAERRMYLPMAGIAAVAAVGIYWLAERLTRLIRGGATDGRRPDLTPSIATGITLLAVAALATLSAQRVAEYRDPLVLWESAASDQPSSWIAHTNYGLELARASRSNEAMAEFRTALRLKPDYAQARVNLGRQLLDAGKFAAAIDEFDRAVQDRPDFAAAHYNLGLALQRSNRPDEAAVEYEVALRLRPDYADAHSNLGVILAGRGQAEAAIAHYLAAIASQPDYFEACANLAVAYAAAGRRSEAIAMAEKALALAQAQQLLSQHEQLAVWLTQYRGSEEK